MPAAPEAPVSTLLRAAILDHFGSVRAFARHLAGPDADHRAVEDERRRINKHLDGAQPTPARAAVYAAELEKPPGYFDRPVIRRSRREQDLEREVERLRGEIERLRQDGQR